MAIQVGEAALGYDPDAILGFEDEFIEVPLALTTG